MQIIPSNGNIVEKILRDKEGRLIRASFFVYENAGRIKARLLSFSIIETISGVTFKLSNIKEKNKEVVQFFNNAFSVPKFAYVSLYTNGSKPRAPTIL